MIDRKSYWEPRHWEATAAAAGLNYTFAPHDYLSPRRQRELCEGVRARVIRGNWTSMLEQPRFWWTYMSHVNTTRTKADRRRCVAELASFKPRICSVRNVYVRGRHKRIFDEKGRAYLPPRQHRADYAFNKQNKEDCQLGNAVSSCGGHGVLSLNLVDVEHKSSIQPNVGVAYFHILFDVLAGLAFMIESMQNSAGKLHLLENVCIDAKSWRAGHRQTLKELTSCAGFKEGMDPQVASLFTFLGVPTSRVRHYPYGRQMFGPSVFLDQASFDCSRNSMSKFRHPHHVLKLRALFHARLPLQPLKLSAIVLINRNRCDGKMRRRGIDFVAGCARDRNVPNHAELLASLQETFGSTMEIVDFAGEGLSVAKQAALFQRTALVIGPHGAGFANLIFCQIGAHIIEFVVRRRNNPTYLGLAHILGLVWWAVISDSERYDRLLVEDVIDTAMSALADPRAAAKHLREHRLLLNASFYDVGLGGCEKGGGITCASDLKALRLPKQRPSTSNAQRG